MALTMEGGGLWDLSAATSARQESAAGAPPFSYSRLRGYASRVEGMLGARPGLAGLGSMSREGIVILG